MHSTAGGAGGAGPAGAAGSAAGGVGRRSFLAGALLAAAGCTSAPAGPTAPLASPTGTSARSDAPLPRLAAVDRGVVYRHGAGPDGCDSVAAREASVFTDGKRVLLHYDGAGPTGWLACLAESDDGLSFTSRGPVLQLGAPGRPDSASASSPWVIFDGSSWRMFYLGTATAGSAPGRLPHPPYETLLAEADHPTGPWTKRYDVVPFTRQPGTYYRSTASPGAVMKIGSEYWQFFSASVLEGPDAGRGRTLGLATTTDLDRPWTVAPNPLLPLTSFIENSSIYYEPSGGGWWWLFTNHVARKPRPHTDAAYAYWSRDPGKWTADQCAVVIDTSSCSWSKGVIGMPTVLPVGGALHVYYDGVAGTSIGHLGRDLGLATLPLPLLPPA